MITFNGVSLPAAVPGIGIVDIAIGPPELETSLRPKSTLAGSYFVRSRLGTRQVRLTVDLSEADAAVRETMRGQLMAWCTTTTPAALQVQSIPSRHLVAICTSLPDFSIAQWWTDLEIEFTAIDPYFIDDAPHTGAVDTAFTVAGDGPAILSIHQQISSPLTNPRWGLDAGSIIQLSGEVDGEIIDIDMEARRVDLNTEPIAVTLSSRFFTVLPGGHTIAGENGAAGAITWYERWL